MADVLRKFLPRSPRYILRPQDKNVMRFGLHEGPHTTVEQTLLVNLSETGVAFVTNSSKSFALGDMVMVEIPIPNGEQIAWWARVVRVEEYEPSRWLRKKDRFFDEPKTLVGATFEALPAGHSRVLKRGIEQSFLEAMREQRHRNWIYYQTLISRYFLQFAIYAILIAVTAGLMYHWTRPSANYDAKRGAPWGERFKF